MRRHLRRLHLRLRVAAAVVARLVLVAPLLVVAGLAVEPRLAAVVVALLLKVEVPLLKDVAAAVADKRPVDAAMQRLQPLAKLPMAFTC